MSDEEVQVRKALVEALTARKLIERRLETLGEQLASLQKQLGAAQLPQPDTRRHDDITAEMNRIKLEMAELQAQLLAQHDLQEQLQLTLFQLENGVRPAKTMPLPDPIHQRDTMDRLEHKISAREEYSKMSVDRERVAQQEEQSRLIEDELEAIKRAMKKEE